MITNESGRLRRSATLTLGSDDEELAMRKAIQHSFAPASLLVCNRHLKENVIRQLYAVTGSRCTVHKAVVVRLF